MVADHVLRLLFSDATAGDVDFPGERWTGVLGPLNDPACFAQARVDAEAETIAWPRGTDLAPEPLYEQAKAIRSSPPDTIPDPGQIGTSSALRVLSGWAGGLVRTPAKMQPTLSRKVTSS